MRGGWEHPGLSRKSDTHAEKNAMVRA
jgi:hypothetical protein